MNDVEDALAINREGWNQVADRFYGGTALPVYGPLAPSEDTLRLLPSAAGMRVLELGCGSGHSLLYLAERGAAELWGLDLSTAQLAFARDVLDAFEPRVRLFESPMEVNPGIPTGYFDLVLSIYGLGWTTDEQWKALYEHLLEFEALPNPIDYRLAYTDEFLRAVYDGNELRWP